MVKALGLSVVLLLNPNFNTAAQGVPPIPGGGDNKPREQTPDEIEAQRKANEELWRKNREAIAAYLLAAPAPEPVDEVAKQRLIAAELLQLEQEKAAEEQRKVDILNWAAEVGERQRASKARAEALAKSYGYTLQSETKDGSGVNVDMVGDRLVFNIPYNLNSAKTISVDKARTNAPAGFGLTGSGIKLGLWDFGVVGTNHVEFTNGGLKRVLWIDTNNIPDPTSHSTLMSGTMVAAGVDAAAQGMAFGAQVLAYYLDGDYAKMGTASVQHGLKISNHSYGPEAGWSKISAAWLGDPSAAEDELFSAYTEFAHDMDHLAYTNMNYLAVWAVGNGRDAVNGSGQNHQHVGVGGLFTDSHNANYTNFGGFGTISLRATAKNIVSVGAIDDLPNGWQSAGSVVMAPFSCWGPTDDGRLAPLVVASGVGVYSTKYNTNGTYTYASGDGTSSAAASVTGTLGLQAQRFQQFGYSPTAATLRGLLPHTADDAGLPGPDYQYGGGLMNADRAARLIMENALTYNPMSGSLLKDGHLLQGVLTNGTTLEFQIAQPANSPIDLTLTWADPPGPWNSVTGQLNPTNSMLVNDLDVVVINPGNATNYPYTLNPAQPYAAATNNAPNWRDNIELVRVATNSNPVTSLTVRLTHKGTLKNAAVSGSTTNQPFSVWVSGNVVYGRPAISLLSQTGTNTVAVAWYATVGAQYKVQYINTVDAPASAWTDVTGWITAQNALTAVEVNYSPSQPQRFYRIKTL